MALSSEEERRATKLFTRSQLKSGEHGPVGQDELRGSGAINPMGSRYHSGSLKTHAERYGPAAKRTKFKGDPKKGAVGPPTDPAFEPEPGPGPIPHDPSQIRRRGEKD